MSRRANPECIFQARPDAIRNTLTGSGMSLEAAGRYCDACEIEAADRGLPRDGSYWHRMDRGQAGGAAAGVVGKRYSTGPADGEQRQVTRPMIVAMGTGPKIRESAELARWSPSRSTWSAGTIHACASPVALVA